MSSQVTVVCIVLGYSGVWSKFCELIVKSSENHDNHMYVCTYRSYSVHGREIRKQNEEDTCYLEAARGVKHRATVNPIVDTQISGHPLYKGQLEAPEYFLPLLSIYC